SSCGFLIRGLITASLYALGTYPNDKDEFMILRRGSIISGSISFNKVAGMGSSIQVADLDALIILDNSSWSNFEKD
ncbi:MAG: hypothetical protein ACRDDA_02375, partial [Aeromonas sp.]